MLMPLPESIPAVPGAPVGPIFVESSLGVRPRFWNRSVTFVANLLGLFFGNEEETRLLVDTVGEVDSYGGRLLPILDLVYAGDERNLLVLEREPDKDLAAYFREVAGLSLPETMVLPHEEYLALGAPARDSGCEGHPAVRRIREHAASGIDGYVTDPVLVALAQQAGHATFSTAEGSRRGNNKTALHLFLEDSGLPVPPTRLADDPSEIGPALEDLASRGFSSGVVKAPVGASGIGLIKVPSLAATRDMEVPRHFFTEGPVMVQAWLRPGENRVSSVRSPSVQLFLEEERIALWDLTEQILGDDSVHEGNESPPVYLADHPGLREELLHQAGEAARWLHRQGYRGTGSVDFLVTFLEEGGFVVYVCEINARVTGATYPAVLARHFLPEGAWLLRNLRFSEPVRGQDILGLLETSRDLFVPGESEFGVMPVNFNTGPDGLVHKGQFLCLSASPRGNKMLLRMAELDLPCSFDRD